MVRAVMKKRMVYKQNTTDYILCIRPINDLSYKPFNDKISTHCHSNTALETALKKYPPQSK